MNKTETQDVTKQSKDADTSAFVSQSTHDKTDLSLLSEY